MSASLASPASRYRPFVVAIAITAAAGSIFYILKSTPDTNESHGAPLRRRNAVRRRRNTEDRSGTSADNETLNENEVREVGAADDSLTEQSIQGEHNGLSNNDQSTQLHELLWLISKDRAMKEGVVHRGITCDGCNRWPITGIRYRCCNCPDFDLCEDCEAQDIHLKTHIFYKIKVPMPCGGKIPSPVWYPGKPRLMPSVLDESTKMKISARHNCPRNKIDGFYLQFTCLASVPIENDSNKVGCAIPYTSFNRCFVPQTSYRISPQRSLVTDRLFAFYDQNKDGMIDFEEFVEGTLLIHNKSSEKRMTRVFRAFDLDDDGYVTRKDFLRFFTAYYNLNEEIILDNFRMERDGEDANRVFDNQTAEDFVMSGRPLASYFCESNADFRSNPRRTEGKDRDSFGDLVPANPLGAHAVLENSTDYIENDSIIGGDWTSLHEELEYELSRLVSGNEAEKPRWGLGTDTIVLEYWISNNLIVYKGNLYVKWEPRGQRIVKMTVFLLVDQPTIEVALGKDADFTQWLDDELFYEKCRNLTVLRCIRHIENKRQLRAKKLVDSRNSHAEFFNRPDRDPWAEREAELEATTIDPSTAKLNVTKFNIDGMLPTEHQVKSQSRLPDTRLKVSSSYYPNPARFQGGSAAAQTIYEITQEALNELLDDLFGEVEEHVLNIHESASLRKRYDYWINCWLEVSNKHVSERHLNVKPKKKGPVMRMKRTQVKPEDNPDPMEDTFITFSEDEDDAQQPMDSPLEAFSALAGDLIWDSLESGSMLAKDMQKLLCHDQPASSPNHPSEEPTTSNQSTTEKTGVDDSNSSKNYARCPDDHTSRTIFLRAQAKIDRDEREVATTPNHTVRRPSATTSNPDPTMPQHMPNSARRNNQTQNHASHPQSSPDTSSSRIPQNDSPTSTHATKLAPSSPPSTHSTRPISPDNTIHIPIRNDTDSYALPLSAYASINDPHLTQTLLFLSRLASDEAYVRTYGTKPALDQDRFKQLVGGLWDKDGKTQGRSLVEWIEGWLGLIQF